MDWTSRHSLEAGVDRRDLSMPKVVWLVIAMMCASGALLQLFAFAPHMVVAENGFLEIIQVYLLIGAFSLYWNTIILRTGPFRSAAVILALITAMIILRELDFRDGRAGYILQHATGSWRDMIFSSVALFVGCYGVWHRRSIPKWVRLVTSKPCIGLFIGAGTLMIAGYMIDQLNDHSLTQRFCEELAEFNAYILYLAAAWSLLVKTDPCRSHIRCNETASTFVCPARDPL